MCASEKKFFRLSVLGVLASRSEIEREYKDEDKLQPNETIKDFFIRKEGIDKEAFESWKEKYKEKIKRISALATKERQEGFEGRKEFLKWYLKKEKICCYCGVKEEDLKKYFKEENIQVKKVFENRGRGQYLEIERIETCPESKNIYSPPNTELACYICNNAKSDFISAKDFKPIAKGINEFWRSQKVEADFDENSNIWKK